jgi:hypothetical protein
MDIAELDGKLFTLWLTDEADESVVYSGIARLKGTGLLLERDKQSSFEIRSEWYERIRTVTSEDMRKITFFTLWLAIFSMYLARKGTRRLG